MVLKVQEIVRDRGDSLEIDVIVSPRSNRSGLDGLDEWRKRAILRVRAPPLDGRANKEVEAFFKDITGCKSSVVSGMTSHQKTVRILGDPSEIIADIERSMG